MMRSQTWTDGWRRAWERIYWSSGCTSAYPSAMVVVFGCRVMLPSGEAAAKIQYLRRR